MSSQLQFELTTQIDIKILYFNIVPQPHMFLTDSAELLDLTDKSNFIKTNFQCIISLPNIGSMKRHMLFTSFCCHFHLFSFSFQRLEFTFTLGYPRDNVDKWRRTGARLLTWKKIILTLFLSVGSIKFWGRKILMSSWNRFSDLPPPKSNMNDASQLHFIFRRRHLPVGNILEKSQSIVNLSVTSINL